MALGERNEVSVGLLRMPGCECLKPRITFINSLISTFTGKWHFKIFSTVYALNNLA